MNQILFSSEEHKLSLICNLALITELEASNPDLLLLQVALHLSGRAPPPEEVLIRDIHLAPTQITVLGVAATNLGAQIIGDSLAE